MGVNNYILFNGELDKLKAKYSEINPTPLCVGNISKSFQYVDMSMIFQLIMIELI